MGPEVTVALIGSATAVIVATITVVGQRRTGRAVDRVETQVAAVHESTVNSHPTNLREDLDEVHADLRSVHSALDRIEANQAQLGSSVTAFAKDARDATRYVRGHDAASALVVEQLHERDDELAAQIRDHSHPTEDHT